MAARSNSAQPVTILPIGLNYSDPTRVRSRLFVNITATITVNSLAEVYSQDANQTVRLLREQIQAALESQIIHTHSAEDNELVKQVDAVYKNKLIAVHQIRNTAEEFQLTRHIVTSIEFLNKGNQDQVNIIQQELTTYLHQLKQLGLNDQLFYDAAGNRHLGKWLFSAGLFFLAGLPLYLFG